MLGKFTLPEEFPVEQLYDIYMQKHSLDDLAFAIEFKVNRTKDSYSIELGGSSLFRVFRISKNCHVQLQLELSLHRKIDF